MKMMIAYASPDAADQLIVSKFRMAADDGWQRTATRPSRPAYIAMPSCGWLILISAARLSLHESVKLFLPAR